MTTRMNPERLSLRTAVRAAVVWTVIGLIVTVMAGWVLFNKTVLIVPVIVIVAFAVIAVQLLNVGGSHGR